MIKENVHFYIASFGCVPFEKFFLERGQPAPIRSVLLVIIGWLVCNTVSSETAPRILVMFCMKLGDYKGRKVIEPDF